MRAICEHSFAGGPWARNGVSTQGRNSTSTHWGHQNIARRGPMPVEQTLPLAMQVAQALEAVHRAGLVHGDVKPHNIFLCGALDHPACIKLIDFGFAQLSSADTPIE